MRILRGENVMRSYVRLSGLVFGLIAVGHLVRTVRRWPLLIAGYPIPAVASLILVVVAGGMAVWAWRLLSQPQAAA
jgi:hypothetical protein